MAVIRNNPYGEFNFLVELGIGDPDSLEGGFQECSAIGTEIAVAEYRNGNDRRNSVRKVTGLSRALDVTLRRGVIGSLNLFQWLDQVRNGDQGAVHQARIQLLAEDRSVAVTWHLVGARIVKYVAGPLNAKGTGVAMEELTLAYERLEME